MGTAEIRPPGTHKQARYLVGVQARAEIVQAIAISRGSVAFCQTPAELGEQLSVPQKALRVQGELQLFDDPEVLDHPWSLSEYDATACAGPR
jgi:type III restriction enzyme